MFLWTWGMFYAVLHCPLVTVFASHGWADDTAASFAFSEEAGERFRSCGSSEAPAPIKEQNSLSISKHRTSNVSASRVDSGGMGFYFLHTCRLFLIFLFQVVMGMRLWSRRSRPIPSTLLHLARYSMNRTTTLEWVCISLEIKYIVISQHRAPNNKMWTNKFPRAVL